MDIIEYKSQLSKERARNKKAINEIHKNFALDSAQYVNGDVLEALNGDDELIKFRVDDIGHGIAPCYSDSEAIFTGPLLNKNNNPHKSKERYSFFQRDIVSRVIEQ